MSKKFFTWLLIFIGLTLILQTFQPEQEVKNLTLDDVVLTTTESDYNIDDTVILNIQNNLDKTLTFDSECPAEPLSVERYRNGVWEKLSVDSGLYVLCGDDKVKDGDPVFFHQPQKYQILPSSTIEVEYSPWNNQLFSETGRYKIILDITISDQDKSFSTEFEVSDRGFFSSVMFNLFFRPIYNFLLILTSILPGYNFGMAVIALTVIIRLLLLAPNHKAMKSQRAMMKIQPELEAIKKKYKGNQEKISQETMALWKKHRVNPIGGCLPMLIQLPILIALFYVVKSGFSPYQSHIIYDSLSAIDLTRVDTNFYGIIDLQNINATWLPILVGVLQFFQMKLSFSKRKSMSASNHGKEIIDIGEKKEDKKNDKSDQATKDPMKMMSKTMIYFMPVMIAFMVASLPSGVGLYLLISTLFGIGQQLFVNKSDKN